MTTTYDTPAAAPLAPTSGNERIAALDVIRGFALIGILLMNIEFFNRYTGDAGMGIQQGISGASLWFSYFVQYFVTGKFWTIFSMLFGMGFAVMLLRAKSAERSFLGPYLRRIVALAVFGVLHYILLWNGDILFGYATAAAGLLIALYGRLKYILLSMLSFGALSALPGMGWCLAVVGGIAFSGLLAWFLRCDDRITVFKRSVPIFKIVVGILMTASVVGILIGLFMPDLPRQARVMTPVMGGVVLVLSILMARYHHPADARPLRLGVGLYCVTMLMLTIAGAVQFYLPAPDDVLVQKMPAAVSVSAAAKPVTTAPAAAKPAPGTPAKKQTQAERVAEKKQKLDKMLAERQAEKELELRVLTTGSYLEVITMRAKRFVKDAPDQIAFAIEIIAMFLIGLWFVRSGVMANTSAHLPLFRKLAFIALPIGVGLGLAGARIATFATPDMANGFMFATGLLMLGNLPASLGYIALVVLLLHSRPPFSRIAILAPYGRMALTNYLTHSLVFSFVFYGYGLGYFGIERIWQLACVCAMVLVQIPLSHLWLSRFRYGPMEWLWRAITYWRLPAMRIAPADHAGDTRPA